MINKCGTCVYFTGALDWQISCLISHPTMKEKEMGITFPFGHICYENTDACDHYLEDKTKVEEVEFIL